LIIFELKVHAVFLEVHIEVGLVYAEWAACQLDVFECLLQINAGSSNDIVALKEVTIISLYSKPVILPWVNFIELEPIVKACFACLAPEVRVSLKRLLVV
jgi:hypothetical protein